MTEIAQFQLYVKHEFEKRLSEMDDLGYDEVNEDEDIVNKHITLARVTFAFSNA